MIPVVKSNEPDELKGVREFADKEGYSPEVAYESLKNPEKSVVIEALKKDQGHVCVYCMSRIPRDDAEHLYSAVTIEHFVPLELPGGDNIGQALDYNNLFAVCHGNMGSRKHGEKRRRTKEFLTCDKHRGNDLFKKIDPLDGETLNSIFYHVDGRIDAIDDDVRFDITKTLNLNGERTPLVKERKAALDELIRIIGACKEAERQSFCEKALDEYKTETDPKTPYVGILIWYLDSFLDSLTKDSF